MDMAAGRLEDGAESRETSAMDISDLFVKLKEAVA
jgi:hypothetical protein